jgi:magnesium-transporting ATPase (P-type)
MGNCLRKPTPLGPTLPSLAPSSPLAKPQDYIKLT